jgi:hypothetical protein
VGFHRGQLNLPRLESPVAALEQLGIYDLRPSVSHPSINAAVRAGSQRANGGRSATAEKLLESRLIVETKGMIMQPMP